jgi:hypothetical protein
MNLQSIESYGPLFALPPEKPRNPFPAGTQNYRLYERLKEDGPLTNIEIMRDLHIINGTGRVSDLRKKLEPIGWTVQSIDLRGGLWKYELVRT